MYEPLTHITILLKSKEEERRFVMALAIINLLILTSTTAILVPLKCASESNTNQLTEHLSM